jgi:hypothetical protein
MTIRDIPGKIVCDACKKNIDLGKYEKHMNTHNKYDSY